MAMIIWHEILTDSWEINKHLTDIWVCSSPIHTPFSKRSRDMKSIIYWMSWTGPKINIFVKQSGRCFFCGCILWKERRWRLERGWDKERGMRVKSKWEEKELKKGRWREEEKGTWKLDQTFSKHFLFTKFIYIVVWQHTFALFRKVILTFRQSDSNIILGRSPCSISQFSVILFVLPPIQCSPISVVLGLGHGLVAWLWAF